MALEKDATDACCECVLDASETERKRGGEIKLQKCAGALLMNISINIDCCLRYLNMYK